MSVERFTLDTNVLVYALDAREASKHKAAIEILAAARMVDCVLTNQSLAEFYAVATRRLRMPPRIAADQVRDWLDLFESAPATRTALRSAVVEAEAGRFSFWDALLLSAADEAGCAVVLSEDMGEGARLGEVVVRSPFTADGAPSSTARRLLGL
jgi:predicted nucleic acid-binding protein